MPPSAFGFAVAVHPQEPDTAWFVPGIGAVRRIPVDRCVVLTQTRDGARSFEVLRRAQLREYASNLTFCHGLEVDQAGRRFASGSTTGSCPVTDDQGDRRQVLGETLPAVYCVHFA